MKRVHWRLVLREWGVQFGMGLGLAGLCGWLAGCAGGGGGGAYQPAPADGAPAAAAAQPWNGPSAPAAGELAARDASAAAAASRMAVPQERPGLATGWGDKVGSAVSFAGFSRASSKPAGTDAIWYNDREGLEAMGGRRWKVESLQQAAGGLVEWGVKGRVGWLPAYKSDLWGEGKRFVQGNKGGRYVLVVKNRCRSRLEVVLSVDGLDVMDGQPASFGKRGYVVAPGDTLEVAGFRTSTEAVAAFEFSSVGASYANLRHGDTRNVGVIGLAVFTERGVDPWRWMPAEVGRRQSARPFAAAP